jgi:hypothetical protein
MKMGATPVQMDEGLDIPVIYGYYTGMERKNTKPVKVTMMWPPEMIQQMKRLAQAHTRSWNGEVMVALREYIERHNGREAEQQTAKQAG